MEASGSARVWLGGTAPPTGAEALVLPGEELFPPRGCTSFWTRLPLATVGSPSCMSKERPSLFAVERDPFGFPSMQTVWGGHSSQAHWRPSAGATLCVDL